MRCLAYLHVRREGVRCDADSTPIAGAGLLFRYFHCCLPFFQPLLLVRLQTRRDGVRCDADSTIRGIDIHGLNLGGPLPVSWSQITTLDVLMLYSNQFTGTLPAEYSTLTLLKGLLIGPDNKLRGTLPPVSAGLPPVWLLSVCGNSCCGAWLRLRCVWLIGPDNKLRGTLRPVSGHQGSVHG